LGRPRGAKERKTDKTKHSCCWKSNDGRLSTPGMRNKQKVDCRKVQCNKGSGKGWRHDGSGKTSKKDRRENGQKRRKWGKLRSQEIKSRKKKKECHS